MDSDFWTSRLAAAKRQYNLQHRHQASHLDGLSNDDLEGEEEVRPDFPWPCPYCYEYFDIASLCSHLEDDHPCDSKLTICPVCYVKVARDMLSHITLQHGNLFKLQRRRRLRRVAIPNSRALSLLGRDLREAHLQLLLGGGAYRSTGVNVSNAATDTFLSSLIMNFPTSEVEEITKSVVTSFEDTAAKNAAPTLAHMWKSSFDSSLSYEERERRIRQATGRAGFVQDLVLTTLLEE
ncbi:hypothetical protein V6N13_048571 [Hibiscus sabdariffa]|uniref:Uncharacterized protein n=1 Tax=Hibiscus sabdariffa TaxID=183260 RepID=A0ABR2F7K4_9ROSI